jgi:arsenate reductase
MTTIYHNPRCSKSRQTLQLLEAAQEEIEIVLYLEAIPSVQKISEIIQLLKITPMQLIRKNETVWKENFKGKDLTDDQLVQAMHDHPKLIERPIVLKNGKAALGRPPEDVLTIL